MNKIEQLIQQLCPEGVEFRELGEITKVLRGRRLTKSQLSEDEKFPVFHGGLDPLGNYQNSNRSGNTVMIINVGASAGTVGFSKVDFWSSDGCYCLENNKNFISRFIYHYLLIQESVFRSKVRRAGIPTLDASVIEKITIPIPPLAIQEEIVSILDKFTALEAELEVELEVELEARTRQYEYYRNQLLSFEGKDVEWKLFSAVGKIRRGVAFTKKEAVEGVYPVVANAPEPITFHSESNRKGEFVVIARSGANAGLISYWNQELFLTDAFSLHPDFSILKPKFLYYFLKKHQREIHSMKKGSGVPHVRASDFEIYSLPIPPLEEQERIVAILDKFDALVNDISTGLPAEIQARRQQYEYYRGKLLTFEPVAVVQ